MPSHLMFIMRWRYLHGWPEEGSGKGGQNRPTHLPPLWGTRVLNGNSFLENQSSIWCLQLRAFTVFKSHMGLEKWLQKHGRVWSSLCCHFKGDLCMVVVGVFVQPLRPQRRPALSSDFCFLVLIWKSQLYYIFLFSLSVAEIFLMKICKKNSNVTFRLESMVKTERGLDDLNSC